MSHSYDARSLGSLATLPAELREEVFTHLLAGRMSNPPASILLVSRGFFQEIEPLMYKHRTLLFDLEPPRDPTVHCSRFYVRDSYGMVFGFFMPKFLAFDAVDANRGTRWLHNYPLAQLATIKVRISAPEADDPGQFMALWKHVVWTVELLQQSQSLPAMVLTFERDDS